MIERCSLPEDWRATLVPDAQAYVSTLERQVEALTRQTGELTARVDELTRQMNSVNNPNAGSVTPTVPSTRGHAVSQRVDAIEARFGISFLISLFESRFTLTPQVLELAQTLGLDPDGVYQVGLLVLAVPLPLAPEGILRRERLAEQVRRLLVELDAPPLTSLALNVVRFLLPQDCSAQPLWTALAAPDLALVMGRPLRGLVAVKQGYDEVRSLLPHVKPGRLHHYEDLLLVRVLMGDVSAHAAFQDALFSPLRQRKNGEVLVNTLLALAENGFRLNQTADQLFIHAKTLRYRLDRASELTGFDLSDAETRFKLQLAAHLLSAQDKTEL